MLRMRIEDKNSVIRIVEFSDLGVKIKHRTWGISDMKKGYV